MKKIATLLAALMLMTAAFAGCGNTDSGSSTASGESSTTSESSVVEESSTASESSEEASTTETGDYGDFTTIEEGKLIMSTNAQFPPYEMVAGDGSFEGIDVEVAQAIAEKLGLELVIDDMDFDSALLAVQNGKSDMVMAGVTVNEEREAVMDFSTSYANGVQVVIVPEGSDITSVDDLEGKQIGCQRGTTGYIYCSDDFGDDAVVAYDSGLTAVQALNNGQVDAVVIDNAPAKEYVAANPGLKVLDTSYAEEDYAIGLAKGSALEDAINAALEELKADGTLQSIVDKYITAE